MTSSRTHTNTPSTSFRSYLFGFLLSIALTIGAFWSAEHAGMSAVPIIVLLALLQLGVQLVFFLHLGRNPAERSNAGILMLTSIIILILLGGTLWIMQNLARLHMHEETPADLYQGGIVAPQNELK